MLSPWDGVTRLCHFFTSLQSVRCTTNPGATNLADATPPLTALKRSGFVMETQIAMMEKTRLTADCQLVSESVDLCVFCCCFCPTISRAEGIEKAVVNLGWDNEAAASGPHLKNKGPHFPNMSDNLTSAFPNNSNLKKIGLHL